MATARKAPAAKKAGKAPAKKVAAKKPAKSAKAQKPKVATPQPKRGVGRPTDYRPEYAEQAYKFALLGATDVRMAELFGVSESTFSLWKNVHPEFSEALLRGKEVADAEIANALFHRAKGYTHAEEDIRTVSLPSGGGSEIVKTPTIKHYPPDTAAATLWLKNRQPAIWREKVEIEHAGKNGGPIQSESKIEVIAADEAYKRMLNGG